MNIILRVHPYLPKYDIIDDSQLIGLTTEMAQDEFIAKYKEKVKLDGGTILKDGMHEGKYVATIKYLRQENSVRIGLAFVPVVFNEILA